MNHTDFGLASNSEHTQSDEMGNWRQTPIHKGETLHLIECVMWHGSLKMFVFPVHIRKFSSPFLYKLNDPFRSNQVIIDIVVVVTDVLDPNLTWVGIRV